MPISRLPTRALAGAALSGLLGASTVGAQTPASATAQEKANLGLADAIASLMLL